MARHGAAIGMALLLVLYVAVSCGSIALVSYAFPENNLGIRRDQLLEAVLGTSCAMGLIPLFVMSRFSFGYIAGLGFYGMVCGYIWLSYFSDFSYNPGQARLSASISLLAFLLPVLFVSPRLKRIVRLSPEDMNRLLVLALIGASGILVWNAFYGLAFVGTQEAGELRDELVQRPVVLRYMTAIAVGAVLPFGFAYFALLRHYFMATASIVLIFLFYPVLLTKTVLFAPIWLAFLLLLFRAFEPKRAAILTLLIPMMAGMVIYLAASGFQPTQGVADYFLRVINLRMFAVPSSAMDHYYDFFGEHPLTYFCQISVVRAVIGCPYATQLGVMLSNHYHLGNFNASLFATEGIASVGPVWAPLSAFCCGLVLSIGNGFSARLPAPLVAASSGIAVQVLLNVPLSTTLLSNGLLVLFLLWYITPDLPESSLLRPPRSPSRSGA